MYLVILYYILSIAGITTPGPVPTTTTEVSELTTATPGKTVIKAEREAFMNYLLETWEKFFFLGAI